MEFNPANSSVKEKIKSPEALVEQIISGPEAVFMRSGLGGRATGKRVNACGYATDLVKRAGELAKVPVKTSDNPAVQRRFGFRGHSALFTHAFNLVSINKTDVFLVDLTACQFFQDSGEIKQREIVARGLQDQYSFARPLMEAGYIRLTDELLREYLSMMVDRTIDTSYLQTTTVRALLADSSLSRGYTFGKSGIQQLDRLLNGQELLASSGPFQPAIMVENV